MKQTAVTTQFAWRRHKWLSNVPYELLSETAVHDEVRAVLVQFAVANWGAVLQNPATKRLSDPAIAETLPHGLMLSAILVELATKAAAKGS